MSLSFSMMKVKMDSVADDDTLAFERFNVEKKREKWDKELLAFKAKQLARCQSINSTSNEAAAALHEKIFFSMRWANPPLVPAHQQLILKHCEILTGLDPTALFADDHMLQQWNRKQNGTAREKVCNEINGLVQKLKKTVLRRDAGISKTTAELKKTSEKMTIKKEGDLRWTMESNKGRRDRYWTIWFLSSRAMLQELERHVSNKSFTDIDERDPDFGLTALHYACKGGNVEVVQWLLDHGASVKSRAPDGRTPLHMAATYSSREVVLAILGATGDYFAKDDFQCTALDLAIQNKNESAVQVLKNWIKLLPPEEPPPPVIEEDLSTIPDEYLCTPPDIMEQMDTTLQLLSRRLDGGQGKHSYHSRNMDPLVEMRVCEKHSKMCFKQKFSSEGFKSLRRRWRVAKELVGVPVDSVEQKPSDEISLASTEVDSEVIRSGEQIQAEFPVEANKAESPVEAIQAESPVEAIQAESPVEAIQAESPVSRRVNLIPKLQLQPKRAISVTSNDILFVQGTVFNFFQEKCSIKTPRSVEVIASVQNKIKLEAAKLAQSFVENVLYKFLKEENPLSLMENEVDKSAQVEAKVLAERMVHNILLFFLSAERQTSLLPVDEENLEQKVKVEAKSIAQQFVQNMLLNFLKAAPELGPISVVMDELNSGNESLDQKIKLEARRVANRFVEDILFKFMLTEDDAVVGDNKDNKSGIVKVVSNGEVTESDIENKDKETVVCTDDTVSQISNEGQSKDVMSAVTIVEKFEKRIGNHTAVEIGRQLAERLIRNQQEGFAAVILQECLQIPDLAEDAHTMMLLHARRSEVQLFLYDLLLQMPYEFNVEFPPTAPVTAAMTLTEEIKRRVFPAMVYKPPKHSTMENLSRSSSDMGYFTSIEVRTRRILAECQHDIACAISLHNEIYADEIVEPCTLVPLLDIQSALYERGSEWSYAWEILQHAMTVCNRTLGPTNEESIRIMLESLRLKIRMVVAENDIHTTGFRECAMFSTEISNYLNDLFKVNVDAANKLAKFCAELMSLAKMLEMKHKEELKSAFSDSATTYNKFISNPLNSANSSSAIKMGRSKKEGKSSLASSRAVSGHVDNNFDGLTLNGNNKLLMKPFSNSSTISNLDRFFSLAQYSTYSKGVEDIDNEDSWVA